MLQELAVKVCSVKRKNDNNGEGDWEDEEEEEKEHPNRNVISPETEQFGVTLSDIEHKVGAVTKRTRLNDLRNKCRNRDVKKSVLDQRAQRRQVIISESDDIVIHFDVREQRVVEWFIKAPP